MSQDDVAVPNGPGKEFVVAGKPPKLLARLRVETPEGLGGDVRGGPVGFGKQDVEPDGQRARPMEALDDVGHEGARPRPLSEPLQARLVDVDDHDRVAGRFAGMKQLIDVEGPMAKGLDRGRIPDPQGHEGDQQDEAEDPPEAETVDPDDQPADLSGGPGREGPCRAHRNRSVE